MHELLAGCTIQCTGFTICCLCQWERATLPCIGKSGCQWHCFSHPPKAAILLLPLPNQSGPPMTPLSLLKAQIQDLIALIAANDADHQPLVLLTMVMVDVGKVLLDLACIAGPMALVLTPWRPGGNIDSKVASRGEVWLWTSFFILSQNVLNSSEFSTSISWNNGCLFSK